MSLSLPMALTLSRLMILPLFVFLMWLPMDWASYGALVIFVAAAVTDFLDGFLARQLNQTSDLGAFLDPVADKLLTITAIVMLIFLHQLHVVGLVAGLLIIWREIGVMALRQAMALQGESIAVSWMAKVKTTIQFLALALLILAFARHDTTLNWVGEGLLAASAVLTAHSFWRYVQKSLPHFRSSDDVASSS